MSLRNYIFHNFQKPNPFLVFSDLFLPNLHNESENTAETVHFFHSSCATQTNFYQKQVLYIDSYEDYNILEMPSYDLIFGCVRDASLCFLPYMLYYNEHDLKEKNRDTFDHRKLLCGSFSSSHLGVLLNQKVDVVDNKNFENYILCICNTYDELWLAIQAECIPIYFGPFWDEMDAKVFNKSRILFSQNVNQFLPWLENIDVLRLLFTQPSFAVSASVTLQAQKQKLKAKLGSIMIKPGYELTTDGRVPLSDEDLRNQKRVAFQNDFQLNKDNIEYKSEFFMDLYQCKLELDYNPSENGRKLLFLFALHVNSEYKLQVVENNLQYFKYDCMDVVVCNTLGLEFGKETAAICNKYGYEYKEIENDKYIDFGKYIYLLGQIDYSKYHTIFFTNDSYILHYPIQAYINYCVKNEAALIAYTDSSERKYHYQSYLFSLKRKGISKFVSFFLDHYEKIENIKEHQDVIQYYEMGLCYNFEHIDCFLKISDVMNNKGMNVYYHNDKLYSILLLLRIMPMTKIKRITKDKKREEERKKKEEDKKKEENKKK
jgi:hypothetical protein